MWCVASREIPRTQVSHNIQPFPPEIINRIIDDLCLWEDKTTILACTLTSPSFRYFSQKRLFEKITLSTQHKDETNTLFTLLYKNPDLVSHIREVSLTFSSDPEASHDEDFGGSSNDMLPDVIKKLRNVVSLNFTDLFYDEDADSRVGLTLDTQKALLHLGHYGKITHLQFDEVRRWPVNFLRHFPRLQRIEISPSWDPFVDDTISNLPVEPGHIVGVPSELKELRMKHFKSPTLFSCIGASHSGLRALAIYSDDASYTSTIEELVRSSTATLEKLKVYHDEGSDTNAGLSEGVLGGLTSLRRISVKGYNLDVCSSLIALLKNTAGIRPIEDISIELCGIDKFSPRSDEAWEELNQCFLQHLKFPHLKNVRITLETSVLPIGTRIENEDTELLERFSATLSCIQANPHVFHTTGNSAKFFGLVEEEEEDDPSWYLRSRQFFF